MKLSTTAAMSRTPSSSGLCFTLAAILLACAFQPSIATYPVPPPYSGAYPPSPVYGSAPPPAYGPYGGYFPYTVVVPTGDPRGTTFDEAVRACSALGMTLVGDDDVVRNLCAVQMRTTCWVNREPVFASNGERLCAIMTQTGDVPFQGCHQQVGYVCAKDGKRESTPLYTTDGPYRLYTEADGIRAYDEAVLACSKVGELVTNEAVVRKYCSTTKSTTCWVGGLPVQSQPDGVRLCAMLSQEGVLLQQDCAHRLGFVCDTSAGPRTLPPPSRRMMLRA